MRLNLTVERTSNQVIGHLSLGNSWFIVLKNIKEYVEPILSVFTTIVQPSEIFESHLGAFEDCQTYRRVSSMSHETIEKLRTHLFLT